MMRWMTRQLGVTLLEVLLVLAIASMIIVMSIRYYQSAVGSQGANTVLEEMQAISAGMDSFATASGSYTSISNPAQLVSQSISVTNITSLSATSASSYTVTLSVSTAGTVCSNVTNQISNNANLSPIYTNVTCGGGSVTYTYQQPT